MHNEKTKHYFSDIAKEIRKPENRQASKWKRFLNCLIDFITTYILVLTWRVLTMGDNESYLEARSNDSAADVLLILVYIIYLTLFELTTSKTLGKLITKTHVVKENGRKLDIKTSIIRSLCRFLPFEVFSFFGKNTIGWHDFASETRVVNDNS